MKSIFKKYLGVWIVLAVTFNVVAFVVPHKFDGVFWMAYLFIMLTFLVQPVLLKTVLQDNATRTFYKIPILTIGYGILTAILIAGILCVLIPDFPLWLEIVICILISAFGIVSVIKADLAGDLVGETDAKIKNKTIFIKSLIADMDSLMTRVSEPEISAELKSVYEAVRYSDPVSNEALMSLESSITLKAGELAECAEKSDVQGTKKLAKEMLVLINDRNKKCKLLK